jgi:hypothetical protein
MIKYSLQACNKTKNNASYVFQLYFMQSSVNEVFVKFKVFNARAGWKFSLWHPSTQLLASTCRVINHTARMRKQKHNSPSLGGVFFTQISVPNLLACRWVTGLDENYSYSHFIHAYIARAAFYRAAEVGTLIVSDRHRHCQLESSNNGEDEGETHSLWDVIWALSKQFEGDGRKTTCFYVLNNVLCKNLSTWQISLQTDDACISSRLASRPCIGLTCFVPGIFLA